MTTILTDRKVPPNLPGLNSNTPAFRGYTPGTPPAAIIANFSALYRCAPLYIFPNIPNNVLAGPPPQEPSR